MFFKLGAFNKKVWRLGLAVTLGLLAGSPAGLVSTAPTFAQTSESQLAVGATATLRDVSSRPVATVELRGGQNQVFVSLTLASGNSLKFGSYGLAITQNGSCLGSNFASAGAVFDPLAQQRTAAKAGSGPLGQLPDLVYSQGL